MTIWKYIGCSLSDLPSEYRNDDKLSKEQIKSLIDNAPLVTGEIEAVTVDALTALLFDSNIMPLKIHPLDGTENTIERLKRLQRKLRKRTN